MGADHWAICPKCNAANLAAKEKQQLDAGAAYGKVTRAEYLKMLETANAPVETKETLREDYEIGVDKNGVFEVAYGCSCSECNFKFHYASGSLRTLDSKP